MSLTLEAVGARSVACASIEAKFVDVAGCRARYLTGSRGPALLLPLSRLLTPLHGYFMRRLYGDPRQATPETIDGYSRGMRVTGTIEHCLARVKYWRQDLLAIEQALSRCPNVPVLLIWGDRDRAVYPSSAGTLLKHFPQGKLVTMRGAGHVPYEENPDEFNRIVLDFLAQA